MKPLIVFIGLVLVGSMIFCFNGDALRYGDEAAGLKEAASECAAAAALSLDPSAYADGRLAFDRDAAVNSAISSFENYLAKNSRVPVTEAFLTLVANDDTGIWRHDAAIAAGGSPAGRSAAPLSTSGAEPGAGMPALPALPAGAPHSVTVCLYLETPDLFRLTGIEITSLCRVSTYELVTP